jgi:hypothetical protein
VSKARSGRRIRPDCTGARYDGPAPEIVREVGTETKRGPRFYITSRSRPAEQAGAAIPSQGSIGNSLRSVLDMVFGTILPHVDIVPLSSGYFVTITEICH